MRKIATVALLLVNACLPVHAQPADTFPMRNYNPFLQVFGVPSFETGAIAADGTWDFSLGFDIVNDADERRRVNETLIIDAETRMFVLGLRHSVSEKLEFGLDMPYLHHSGGFLDSAIKNWHSALGLPNPTRAGLDDRLSLYFEKDGVTLIDFSESSSGLGDIRLSAAMRLRHLTIRAGAKLPTGDPDKLTGSGAADFSLGIYGDRSTTFFDRRLDVGGFAGVLALGDGEILPGFQRSMVPYGGLAFRWQATGKVALSTLWHVQGSYFDLDIDEIGGTTFQLGVGLDYRFEKSLLRFAIVEDIAGGATPDVALHLSFRSFGG